MSEWPDDWFRRGSGGAQPQDGSAASDPTVQVPGPGGAVPAGQAGAPAPGSPGWPQQPPLYSAQQAHGGRRRAWLRPRRILAIVAVLIALLLIGTVGTYFYLNSKLTRQNVLVDYPGRPAQGAGQNWLIAGSDSRQGLTAAQERRLSTGFDVSGHRSDTIMLLHIPANGGRPVLISLPRDSYVPIPGNGYNKINAAFAIGGPKLLAETVQNVTGLRIDHYMEIGFGGFVGVVNAVGGVQMCLKHPLHDVASGLNLKAGCQTLDGAQALGYVRDRHSFADQDLQRVQDQRAFLKALLHKVTSPGVMLNPFAALPAADGAASTLTVDQGTSLYQLIQVAFALRDPITTTVPIANPNYLTSNAGDAVLWNRQAALELFRDLRTDHPLPKQLVTGSGLGG